MDVNNQKDEHVHNPDIHMEFILYPTFVIVSLFSYLYLTLDYVFMYLCGHDPDIHMEFSFLVRHEVEYCQIKQAFSRLFDSGS